MSAIIRQMVMRKRAAEAQAAANAAAYADVVAKAKGEPGIRWRGRYQSGADYAVGDAVAFKGSSYIATSPSPGAPPGPGWDILAEKGKDGKAGKDGGRTTIYSGGGGGSELYGLPTFDPLLAPTYVAIKQNGTWVQILWADFLTLIGSAPAVLPNQIVVNGVGVTVAGAPVFVTPTIVPNQILVNGVGITVNGDPVLVTPDLVASQVTINGIGVTVQGDPVTVGGSVTQLVYSNNELVTVNNQPIEVTI